MGLRNSCHPSKGPQKRTRLLLNHQEKTQMEGNLMKSRQNNMTFKVQEIVIFNTKLLICYEKGYSIIPYLTLFSRKSEAESLLNFLHRTCEQASMCVYERTHIQHLGNSQRCQLVESYINSKFILVKIFSRVLKISVPPMYIGIHCH